MTRPGPARDNPDNLRSRAEEAAKAGETGRSRTAASPAEIELLLHDLQVHQIELEMQNDELRRTQAELEASRERYFDLYDRAPVGYVTLDEEGLILEANLTAARFLGVATGVLVRRRLSSFILLEHQDMYYLYRRRQAATGTPERCELRMARHGSGPFWALLESATADDGGGAAVCRLVISDITEQTESRLIEAQRMESVGLLAGGVAHEFNNLLTVINGYSVLLLRKLPEGDPSRAALMAIRDAGASAAELTGGLLAYGRKQLLQPRLLDLNRLVEAVRPLLEGLVGESVKVRVHFGTESATVVADWNRLQQVLINLALNARDAMPKGGVLAIQTSRVQLDASQVQSHPSVRAGPHVLLAVRDSGVGMNEQTRRRIFEPFFTTKEVGKGTGLGLSVVQGITAQSGGYVEVLSEPECGATFNIYLPMVVEPAREASSMPKGGPLSIKGKETVLVVEDQAAVRAFVMQVLADCGYRVLEAESGVAALALCEAESGSIDLVLTDMVMPGISGRELANRLRMRWPEMKVLFMSGYTNGAIAGGHEVPEEKFMKKPFNLEELRGKVRATLGHAVSGLD